MEKIKELSPYILAGLVVVGFFALLYILIFVGIPDENKDVLNLVVGALIGSFAGVVNYYFGSSAGSKEKTKILSKSQPVG